MSHHMPVADIQFISDFAVFARSKGDRRFDFQSWTNCAVCQFLRSSGRARNPEVLFTEWGERMANARVKLPKPLWSYHSDDGPAGVLPEGKQTFSALADRLEALIADAPKVTK